MKKYIKIALTDESGTVEEHENAVVVTGMEGDKVSIKFVNADADGVKIAIAAYALLTAVNEMELMPLLEELIAGCPIAGAEYQIWD